MDIRTALDRIVAVQGNLTITDPITTSVAEAWKYRPPGKVALNSFPLFMNEWTFVDEKRANSLREQEYTVHMQLAVLDADANQAADIASAFHGALVDAFDADVNLDNTVTRQSLRGGNPTLVNLEFAGQPYIGLDLFMDIVMSEGKTFGP